MVYDLYPRIYTDEYYLALGRFVSDFSEVEQAMQVSLWVLCKVKPPVAQAVFSGVRADDAVNKIARIGAAENWSKERLEEWKAICDQFGHIRSFRNDILHYGVKWESEGEWITTNRQFVHISQKITISPVNLKILQAATEDLQSISLHMFNFVFDASNLGLTALDRTIEGAWRYKQPPQGGRPGKSHGKSPKPKRRPRSSPG